MADTVSREVRSRIMAAIRSKNTKPELALRRGLHALGFRYALHSQRFAGKPDLIFPKYRAVIFVNGCYWHGHSCDEVKLPSSNAKYWLPKIARTQQRDASNQAEVERVGWRYLVVWECAFRRKGANALAATIHGVSNWLLEGRPSGQIGRGIASADAPSSSW